MHPFKRAEYEPLPGEEKQAVDQEDASIPVKSSGLRRITIASIITLVSLLAFLVTAKVWAPPIAEEPVERSEKLHDYLARATGDQYLLGVGKGDITG